MKEKTEKKISGNFVLKFEIEINKVKEQDLNFYDPQVEKAIIDYLLPNIQKLLEVGLEKNRVSFKTKSYLSFKKKNIGGSMFEKRRLFSQHGSYLVTIPKWFIEKLKEANKELKYFKFYFDEEYNSFSIEPEYEDIDN